MPSEFDNSAKCVRDSLLAVAQTSESVRYRHPVDGDEDVAAIVGPSSDTLLEETDRSIVERRRTVMLATDTLQSELVIGGSMIVDDVQWHIVEVVNHTGYAAELVVVRRESQEQRSPGYRKGT